MKLRNLILLLAFSLVNGLNFFTATVDPPDSPYSQILSGNDVFESLYGTFNSTGLVLLGSAIVLSAGKMVSYCLKNYQKSLFHASQIYACNFVFK